MKAAVISRHGGPEVIEIRDVPRPHLSPGQVLVRVRACAINHLDVWVRRGIEGAGFHLPRIGGGDIAGEVVELASDVAPDGHIEIGAAVMVMPAISCGFCERCVNAQDHLCSDFGVMGETLDGGLAEFVAVPRANLVPKPSTLSFEEAASVNLTFLTAWHMLIGRAGLRFGDLVLVQAAGSGVSCAAIQIAKHVGATVVTTASKPRKLEAAKALGADRVVDYTSEDFVGAVRDTARAMGKRGADVIIEHVGGDTFERSMRCLARGGRLVTCGATTGAIATLNIQHLFFKNQSVLGSTMGTKAEYHELVRLFGAGKLKPVIDRVLPLAEIRQAHRALEAREVFGKVVLIP